MTTYIDTHRDRFGVEPICQTLQIAPPTYVRWAVDKTGDHVRPYFLDLFYDGTATNYRIIDGSGQVVLRVPISGSGIFGPETCVSSARPGGKVENATWIAIDANTPWRFIAEAVNYQVQADSVSGSTVTVPLSDSGCRAN